MGASNSGDVPAGTFGRAFSPSGILPAEHWTQQETPTAYEDEYEDRDSALGEEEYINSAFSLTSSIVEYRTLHGRTYHSANGSAGYWFPNDDLQTEAMDINHHLLTLVLDGKLFRAPIGDNVQRVLDVGTGTGIWAIDFADQYPEAEVIGTDISPIQPVWLPSNLRFEIDDATLDWTFKPDSFDFIHMRYLFGAIPDWTALYKQAYKCCKPGGYLEDFEASMAMESEDGSIAHGSPMHQWGKLFREGGRIVGRPFTVVEDDIQRKGMEEAGFTGVTTWDFKCPIGGWPQDKKLREMGLFSQLVLSQDLEGYILYTWNQVMGWSREEIDTYTTHMRHQMKDKSAHPFFRMRLVYGQKPGATTAQPMPGPAGDN